MCDDTFRLEITGLPTFAAFVAILRGKDEDVQQIAQKIHDLTAKAQALQQSQTTVTTNP